MKLKLLSLIVILAIYLGAMAQTPSIQWGKVLGGSMYDIAYSIQQTNDGGYIVAGSSNSNDGDVVGFHFSNSSYIVPDFWIIKLDSIGHIIWQKCLGGNLFDVPIFIQQTTDSGYIVAGITASNDGDVSGCHSCRTDQMHWIGDYWVVKLNSKADIVWQKCLGGSNTDIAYSIQQTKDGGYVVAGHSSSIDGDVTGNHGSADFWIVKLNCLGNIVWQKSLGGSSADIANSFQQTKDGGYIVAGSTNSNDGDVSGNHGKNDYWIVKLDSIGKIVWQKCLGGTNDDYANYIIQTKDLGYMVAGYSSSNNGDLTGNNGNFDYWIIKLDTSGNITWQKNYGGSSFDIAHSIQQTNDLNYIILGETISSDGIVVGNHSNDGDFWAIKLDTVGNLIWQKCLGGTNVEVGNSVNTTKDGGFILAGYSVSNDGDVPSHHGNNSNEDYWIVKLAPDTLLLPLKIYSFNVVNLKHNNIFLNWQTASEINTTHFNIQRSTNGKDFIAIGKVAAKGAGDYSYKDVSTDNLPLSKLYYRLEIVDKDGSKYYSEIKELSIGNGQLIISPNPAKDKVTITGTNIKQVRLLDNTGKIVVVKEVANKEAINIPVSHLPKGLYMVQATYNDGSTKAEKLVVE